MQIAIGKSQELLNRRAIIKKKFSSKNPYILQVPWIPLLAVFSQMSFF